MQNAENVCSQWGSLPELKFIQLARAWVTSMLKWYQPSENLTSLEEYEVGPTLLHMMLYWALEDGH